MADALQYFYSLIDPFFNLTPWEQLNKILGVLIFAILFSLMSKYLSRFKPEEELENTIKEIKRISELSRDALDVENYKMYAILQKQGNELIYHYYLLLTRGAMLEISPHLLGICISEIGLRRGAVFILPFTLPLVGNTIGGTIWYIVCAIIIHKFVFKSIKKLKTLHKGKAKI